MLTGMDWIPACAGMTENLVLGVHFANRVIIPAIAGAQSAPYPVTSELDVSTALFFRVLPWIPWPFILCY
jgi:hypothetical protein